MPDARVHVVGSLNLDRTMRVRSLPAAGETVAATGLESTAGGKGGNQAVAAARAGAAVRMAGAVGADAEADVVLAALRGAGVDVDGVGRVPGVPTGAATILVDDAGENVIVLVAGANGTLRPDDAGRLLGDASSGDLVLLQGEIPADASQAVAARARSRGARVVWTAAPVPASVDDVVTDVDLLLVNRGELDAVARLLQVQGDPLPAVADRLGATVVTTLGPDGAVARHGGATVRVPSPRVDAVDTTGAGDTFAGVLAAALAAGLDLETAMRRGAAAGALAVTRRGAAAAIPDAAEVDRFLAAGAG